LSFHNIVESILLVSSLFPRETAFHFSQELVELRYNSKLMFAYYLTENTPDKIAAAKPKKRAAAKKGADKDDEPERLPHPGFFAPLELYGGDFSDKKHWGYLANKFLTFLQDRGDRVLVNEQAAEKKAYEEVRAGVLARSGVDPAEVASGAGEPSAKRAKLG
jgi:hypothetical protein